MDLPTFFKFPPGRDAQPLYPLSPERVNGMCPPSTATVSTTTTRKTSKTSSTESREDVIPSPQSSPTRKARAHLFADYHPTSGSPPKNSSFALPQSPSLPEINALRSHARTNSDVQGLVKRFEHLDVRDRDAESVERRKKHEAELQRVQIAREEAESDARRWKEETRRLKREGDDGRERERIVGMRLEVVLGEFGAAKEAHASQSSVYEKELRKARKEAFKSSSTVLKLQEELKFTRNSLHATKSTLEFEKQKVQQKEQQRFEMEYQLISMQDRAEKLEQRLRISEEEKEVLKAHIKEEEVARIAAEGMIALPTSQDQDDDLLSSPRKQSPQKRVQSPLSDDKENLHATPKKVVENRQLAKELERERARREHAEDLADFLQIECMFRCCHCRTASRLGHDFALSLDSELATGIEKIREGMVDILTPPGDFDEEKDEMEVESESVAFEAQGVIAEGIAEIKPEQKVEGQGMDVPQVEVVEDTDQSMTMVPDSPNTQVRQEAEEPTAPPTTSVRTDSKTEPVTEATETTMTVPIRPSTPPPHQQHQTMPFRHQPSVRTVTTTTTVPMHFTPISKPAALFSQEDSENIPPSHHKDGDEAANVLKTSTFDRAAALAAIEYRRGRAKSIADGHATPRKQMLEGVKERRDISAPALGQKIAGGGATVNFAKGAASVGRNGRR